LAHSVDEFVVHEHSVVVLNQRRRQSLGGHWAAW